jgi:hypothetical protein
VKIWTTKSEGPPNYVPLMLKAGARKEGVASLFMKERELVLQRLVCSHQLVLEIIEV